MGATAMSVLALLAVTSLVRAAVPTAAVLSDKLVAAINKKDYDRFVAELTSEGIDTNQPDTKGKLPIVEAARTRDVRFVDSLIQYGAFVRVSDASTGSSPLHASIQTGATEITRLLLAYGANLDAADKTGRTPRELVGNHKSIRELVDKYDKGGPAAFEDAPGTWTKATKDKADDEYWFNTKTSEARWNTPPSCAWQRLDVQGQPAKYINSVTAQETTKVPAALAWRHVHMTGHDDVWYNWAVNITQMDAPHEVPERLLKELKQDKNVRWYNEKTHEFAWEDPKYHTHWRVMLEEGADKPYYYNIETSKSQWEVPDQLAWEKVESDQHPGSFYFWNSKTGESSWEAPDHLSWSRHDSDL